jgi:DNA-binding IclR family transcriptional regulator
MKPAIMKQSAPYPTAATDLAEQHALERLRRTHGLTRISLRPHDETVQLVGYDGRCIGRIRQVDPHTRRWSAVPAGAIMSLGHFASPRAAAAALARAAGVPS